MNRRGFLQALFAIPVVAAPLLIPASVAPEPPAPEVSYLPKTYAGRLEYIAGLHEAGIISYGQARDLLMSQMFSGPFYP